MTFLVLYNHGNVSRVQRVIADSADEARQLLTLICPDAVITGSVPFMTQAERDSADRARIHAIARQAIAAAANTPITGDEWRGPVLTGAMIRAAAANECRAI